MRSTPFQLIMPSIEIDRKYMKKLMDTRTRKRATRIKRRERSQRNKVSGDGDPAAHSGDRTVNDPNSVATVGKGLMSRLVKLNCAASRVQPDSRDDNGWNGTTGTFDTSELVFDFNKRPAPCQQVGRMKARDIIPILSSVQENGASDDADGDNDYDSDSYFTDDDSSASSGLQVNTMDADSASDDEIECCDRYREGKVLSKAIENRIGIRPFLLPRITSSTSEDDDLSSVFSPPKRNQSDSPVSISTGDQDMNETEEKNDRVIFDDSKTKISLDRAMVQEFAQIQASLKMMLGHVQNGPNLLNSARNEAARSSESTGECCALELESSPIINDFALDPPPSVHRKRELTIRSGRSIPGSRTQRAIRPYGLEEFTDEKLQQLPLLFHPQSETKQFFRSSSPGLEPTFLQSRVSATSPTELAESMLTSEAKSARQSFGPSENAKTDGQENRESELPGSDVDSSWRSPSFPSIAASNREKEANDFDHPSKHRVRWSNDLQSCHPSSWAATSGGIPRAPHRSRPNYVGTSMSMQIYLSAQGHVTSESEFHSQATKDSCPDSISSRSQHLEAKHLSEGKKCREEAPGPAGQSDLTAATQSVRGFAHGSTSEDRDVSVSGIKALIQKFDSQASNASGHETRKSGVNKKESRYHVDVLSRRLIKDGRISSVKIKPSTEFDCVESSPSSSKSYTVSQVSSPRNSGFSFRSPSYESKFESQVLGNPAQSKSTSSSFKSEPVRMKSPTFSVDGDGMTTGTETTHDTTTDDDTYQGFCGKQRV